MSGEELHSLETVLEKYVPPQELAEVKRILYGRPAGVLELGEAALAKAGEDDYEIAGWSIGAAPEETRPPREVSYCHCLLFIIVLIMIADLIPVTGEDWSDSEQDCVTNVSPHTGPG